MCIRDSSIPEEYAVRVTVPEIRGVWLTNVDSEVEIGIPKQIG
ncbi:FenI [Geitlerinema sp. FC II]|nr:FenI [Geitlerinema sp. FC II]